MKRTTFLKTIVLAAAILGGVSSAWAQTTQYYRTLTGTESADAAEQAWSASDIGTGKWETISGTPTVSVVESENVIGLKSLGVGTISNSSQISPSENVKLTIDCVWEFNGGNSADNNEYLQIGSNIRINALPKATSGNVTYNSTDVRAISNACSSSGNRWNDTWTIHIEINTATNKVTALTIAGAHDTKPASYTLSGEVALTGSPTFSITMGQNNRSDSYVLLKSIKITETPQYTYSVHWKSGDTDMGEFTSGYDVNDASITIPYYRYLSTNHELYKISTGNGSDVPTVSFTKTADDQTEYMIGYTKQDAGYVVFCEEAENIIGMTASNSQGAANRASGRKIAYCSEDVTITTLPAGTYTITAGLHGNNNNSGAPTFLIKAGETTILSVDAFASSTRGEYTSEPFTINETTDIKVCGGTYRCGFDNFYIVCTSGRVSAVDALGYTFSSTLPLDFTGTTVEAYTAAYNSTTEKVDLTRVYKVPANTGLFIKGTAADIPVLTGDADVIGTNNLVAVSSTTTVNQTDGGTNTNFVLGVDNAAAPTAAVFLKAPLAGVSVGAGKAYLQIPTANVPTSRLAVVFNDETTGVSEELRVKSEVFATAPAYSLQGQRVAQPKKGLYIMNGKKIIVK